LITALILEYGYTSGYVAIDTNFGVIVMFDSMGVRRQSGEQGIVLVDMLKELRNLSKHQVKSNNDSEEDYHPTNIEERKMILKKYLGHKPVEVFVGILTGIFVAFVVRWFYSKFGIM